MKTPGDRRQLLRMSLALNGIDFVRVDETQTKLEVHFLNASPDLEQLKNSVKAHPPLIGGGDALPTVPVLPISEGDWSQEFGQPPVLTLRVAAPGDFSQYTLSINSPLLDPVFSRSTFSFKANCPSTLDCAQRPEDCARELPPPPPIDYLAKDFLGFRKALSDFSALRYPEWRERSEADFGVMFMEALSSLADDLSYLQDRIAAEAWFDTATQRRSLVRHARLVDYEPRPAMAAQVWLWLNVTKAGALPAGLPVSAFGPDEARIDFETGLGLEDTRGYPVNPDWNENKLIPYAWDESGLCLPAGSTRMWLEGHKLKLFQGQWLVIDTSPELAGNERLRALVQLTEIQEEQDTLRKEDVTRISWRPEDALARDHALTRTQVRGNLVPATQGRRFQETFAIERVPSGNRQTALVRTGPQGRPQLLFPLARTPLAWLPSTGDADAPPRPDLLLDEQGESTSRRWRWKRSLLDADGFDPVFTVDPIRYRPVGSRHADGTVSMDYDGDGETLRFGDGTFGDRPEEGTTFQVTYRTGVGARGNVAADSITLLDPAGALGAWATQVGNPFAAWGGADEETAESVRQSAPEAFRTRPLHAVRPEDYEDAAETLPWVQRAGTTLRYTGSWHTVFTAADPLSSGVLSPARHLELAHLLGRRRLAGHESYASAPRYVPLDLQVHVCARPDSFQGEVERAVREALSSKRLAHGKTGFFHVDRFTFGTPLERSVLEREIQLVQGVAGVLAIRFRRRGFSSGYEPMPETLSMGRGELLRMDGNPSRPEHGSIDVIVEGGR